MNEDKNEQETLGTEWKKEEVKHTVCRDVQDVTYRLLTYMVMSNVFCAIVLLMNVAKVTIKDE